MHRIMQAGGMSIDKDHTLRVVELAELLYNLRASQAWKTSSIGCLRGRSSPRSPSWISACSFGGKVLPSTTLSPPV